MRRASQRIGCAEVVVVLAKDDGGRVERELRLIEGPLLGDDPDFRVSDAGGGPIQVSHGQEQEVRGHAGGRGEAHARSPVAEIRALRYRHVADRHLAAGYGRLEIERRTVGGLVPRRDEPARVGVLELREERALAAGRGVVVESEQPHGLGADLARVVDREPIGAARDRPREGEGRSLGGGVHRDLGGGEGRRGRSVRELHRGETEVDGVQRDAGRRLKDLDGDRGPAAEGQRPRVRGDGDLVVCGDDAPRKLRRHVRAHGRGRGRIGGRGDRGHGQDHESEQHGENGGGRREELGHFSSNIYRARGRGEGGLAPQAVATTLGLRDFALLWLCAIAEGGIVTSLLSPGHDSR